jgi:hypothetical protein
MRLDSEIIANQFDCAVQADGVALVALAGEFSHPFFQLANVFA